MYTRGSSTRAVTTLRRSDGDLRRLRLDRRNRRSALQRAEVLLHQRLRLRRVEVADDGEAGVVGRVVLPEELLHVVELRRLDVFVRADDVAVVRMPGREQRLRERLPRPARTARSRRSAAARCGRRPAGSTAPPDRPCRAGIPCDRTRATARAPAGSMGRSRSSWCGRSRWCRSGRSHRRPRAGGCASRAARASSSGTSCARRGARIRCGPCSSLAGPT